MIQLKDFVAETLRQIIEGVKSAQEAAASHGGKVSPKNLTAMLNQGKVIPYDSETGQMAEHVEFDVAVTTSETDRGHAGIGVFVGGFGIGSKAEMTAASQSISRIKFSVPIFLPQH